MKTYLKIVTIILGMTFISCKKNGTGGKAKLEAHAEHHEAPIYGATYYLKFNATELPSNPTSNYDLKLTAAPGVNAVVFENMLRGDYYIYSEGFDTNIGQNVKGGIAVKIKYSERKKELHVNVPVTE
jgi:hypothetical protein